MSKPTLPHTDTFSARSVARRFDAGGAPDVDPHPASGTSRSDERGMREQ